MCLLLGRLIRAHLCHFALFNTRLLPWLGVKKAGMDAMNVSKAQTVEMMVGGALHRSDAKEMKRTNIPLKGGGVFFC